MKIFLLLFCFVTMAPFPVFAKKDAESFFLKGEKYFEKDQYSKAEKFYQKAIKDAPETGKYWLALGMAKDAQGNFEGAIADYQKALDFKDTPAYLAYNNLGVSYGKNKKHSEAVKALLKSIKSNPKYAPSYYNLGIAYYRLGKKSLARQQFQKLKKMGEVDMAQVLWEKIYR